jgi:hypothetical protein
VGRRENRGRDQHRDHVEEERGGVRSAQHAHEQGPPAGSGAGARRGVRSGGPHLEERGGTWAAPRTRGPAEEKEGAGPCPREQCQF